MQRLKRAIRWLAWWPDTARSIDKVLLAGLWFLIGLTVWLEGDDDPYHHMPLEWLPVELRVTIWWGAALFTIINLRLPPGRDHWGWAILAFPVALRALNFVLGTILGMLPIDPLGDTDAWRAALAWTIVLAFVLRQAARPELPRAVP